MGGKGEGRKKKEKRARPNSSTCTSDELEEDGRHYEELLTLYKALEQKDAEKVKVYISQAYKPSFKQRRMK